MAAAGALVAVQARVNGELGVRMHSALAATAVSFAVAVVPLGVAAVVSRRAALRRLAAGPTPWWYWTGGLGGVASSTALAAGTPRVGVSLVSVCLAAGMAAGALVADRIGLGPSGRHPVNWARIVGAVLTVGAVALAASNGLRGTSELPTLAWLVAGGFATGWQQPINGRLSRVAGDALAASLVSFGVGLGVLLLLMAATRPQLAWPGDVRLYTGGCIAALYVWIATTAVARVGALRVSLAAIGGQLVGAAVLDAVAPVPGHHLTVMTVGGAILALIGMVVAGGVRPGGLQPGTRRTPA